MLFRKLLVTAAIFGGLFATSARAADWPCFGGPTHDFIAPDTGLNKDWAARPPKTLWTVSLSDNGHAGPSIAGGKVYIVDHQQNPDQPDGKDVVRALDFATGAEIWTFAYADAKKNRYGFTESTPLVAGGKVYVVSRLCKVQCLDAATGSLVWTRDVLKDFSGKRPEWDFACSPAIVDGKLIVIAGGKGAAVVALDAATGETVWQGGGDSIPGYATPLIATLNGQQQIVASVGEGLVGIDIATGKRLWNFPWPVEHDQNSATPTIRGNTIFMSAGWGKGSAMVEVNGGEAKALWTTKEMQARFATPVVYNGRIYGTQDPGKLVCLDAKSGEVVWKQSGFEFASTLAADGCILVLEGKSGNLLLLDAGTAEYTELGRICPLGGPDAWCCPILCDGKLLIRNKKSLACVDLR